MSFLNIVNSAGVRDEETWGKRADWCDYYGPIGGKTFGIAIFDNPANPRHPTSWHVRDYGLLAVNPFGAQAFDKSLPVQNSVLDAGRSLHLQYRVVIHAPLSQSQIEALYQKFAGR